MDGTIVLTGGNVFVGNGQLLENSNVVIEGERIVKVSQDLTSTIRDAIKIPFNGCTLMPGLIDCHTHICLDSSIDPFETSIEGSLPTRVLQVAQNAKKTLLAGVTTIRDMGGIDNIDLEIKNAINSGLILGPRILASGKLICITGGHGWSIGREVDGVDDIVKAVREQIKSGADVIKFIVTGGVMENASNPSATEMNEEELVAGIREAHKFGKKTAGHAKAAQGIELALHAGIDSIEHGTILTDKSIYQMKEKNVPVVFTLSALYNIEHKGEKAGLSKYLIKKALSYKPRRQESIYMAQKEKVITVMGTDAGTPLNQHGDNPNELIRLVEVGYSPIQALISATGVAAKVLGIDDHLGTIEEGKTADLIIIKGDPLQDINLFKNNSSIGLIIKNGQIVFKSDELGN